MSLPCSGKVTIPYLLKALENGADGVLLMTCPREACRFLEGSSRAGRRVRAVDDLMEETGLGRGRIRAVQIPDRQDAGQAAAEVAAFVRDLDAAAGKAA